MYFGGSTRFNGAREGDITVCKGRIVLVASLFCLLLTCVAGRALLLASEPGHGKSAARAGGSTTATTEQASAPFSMIRDEEDSAHLRRRGVVDRNGKALAINLTTSSLYAKPLAMPPQEKERAAKALADALGLEREHVRALLNKNSHFAWIKRHLTPREQDAVNTAGVAGVYFEEDEQRVYPYKRLFSHIIGYDDIDGKGLAGIERSYNQYLSKGASGSDELQLSLDVAVQHAARSALEKAITGSSSLGGCAVVADVATGEILAMTSLPDFDPNVPGQSTNQARFNMAALGVYEPGSTFKIFNTALGLEQKAISLNEKIEVSEPLRIGRFTIRDYHPEKAPLTPEEIFMKSSNIGSAKIALRTTPEKQRTFFKQLGMLDALPLEIPEHAAPLPPTNWGKVAQITVSFGHGIAVTPLHLVQGAIAMVNGGTLYPLTLLSQKGRQAKGVRVISKETSDAIRRMMRLTVQFGTGKNADVPHYMVGGKTGTADKALNGHYGERRIVASFLSAFPMNAPRYIVLVMLDEPHLEGNARATGGNTAAPAVHDIISEIAPLLGVPPVDENEEKVKEEFLKNIEKYEKINNGRV